jgi:hypothetical protein
VSARRLVATCFATVLLALLAWPAASLADHITIQASVVAVLKERFSSNSWLVEVKWSISCVGVGPKGASYSGNLYLVDVGTHESIYLGGVLRSSWSASSRTNAFCGPN